MVGLEQVRPGLVAQARSALGRSDDVGEKDGRQHPIVLWMAPSAGQELLDLLDHAVGIADPG